MSVMLLAVSWKFLFSLSCAKCIQRNAPETDCLTERVRRVLEEICFPYLARRIAVTISYAFISNSSND